MIFGICAQILLILAQIERNPEMVVRTESSLESKRSTAPALHQRKKPLWAAKKKSENRPSKTSSTPMKECRKHSINLTNRKIRFFCIETVIKKNSNSEKNKKIGVDNFSKKSEIFWKKIRFENFHLPFS